MLIKNGNFKKISYIISNIYVSPFITKQPVGGIVKIDNPFTFTIKAEGSRPLKYQWYKNGIIIDGAITNTLTYLSCSSVEDARYFCTVTNYNGSINTDTVKLNVVYPPVIVSNPVSLTAVPASTVKFSVSATGTIPLTYQWFRNNEIFLTSLSSIYITNVQKPDESDFYVVVSNIVGSVSSTTASLKIYDELSIITQPEDLTLNVHQTSALHLSCVGTIPISAQWRKDGINYGPLIISNTYSINLNLNNVDVTSAGYYDCVLSNIVNTVTSDTAHVYVNSYPLFLLNPSSSSVEVGDTVVFIVNTIGTDPITFQWKKGNMNVGTSLNTYTITDTQLSAAGNYMCVATNLVSSVSSSTATLTVSSQYLTSGDGNYIMFDSNSYWKIN